MKNGYFQVGCSPSGTIVRLVKPEDGGRMVSPKELAEYLTSNGVMYEAALISKGIQEALASPKNEFLFLVNKEAIPEIRESYVLSISDDKMTAVARFYPPSMKGGRISAGEFISDLANKNIQEGIQENVIQAFFQNPTYNTEFIVAEGTPAKQGKDAEIEYFFKTDVTAKPTLSEDGSVDFFNLNLINHCKKDDVLARLYPEEAGEPGVNIFGERVMPREVKRAMLKCGRNITLSPDKRVLTSEVDGHVMLVDDKVFVSNVFEAENVDTATGNIDYDGSVRINGNVCTNFSVKAKGNIEVRGVVEGAYLEAEGDIIIQRGMNGMNKGILKAGGNIVSKFIENASISAVGYVSTESILHSIVMAGSDIIVNGKKGFITGGRVCATELIQVKTLGSTMGADTVVEVGVDPSVKLRIQELQKRLTELKKIIENSHPVLTSMLQKMQSGVKFRPDQMKYFQELLQSEKANQQELESGINEINQLQSTLDAGNSARVEVTGEVFAGTKICISDVSTVVKTTMTYCKFIKSQGDVKMVAL